VAKTRRAGWWFVFMDAISTILLIGGRGEYIDLIGRAFQTSSSKVGLSVVNSIKQAREYLEKTTVDLVIADYLLADGKITEILSFGPNKCNCPMVVLAEEGDVKAIVEVMEAGAVDCLIKSPKTISELPGISERILQEADYMPQSRVINATTADSQTKQLDISQLRRFHKQQSAMVRLAIEKVVAEGHFREATRNITETAGKVLAVERVSLWLLHNHGELLRCIDLFESSTGRHCRDMALDVQQYPNYFRSLNTERVITAHEVRTDIRTKEFNDGYFVPLGITSIMDGVVRVLGKTVGVVCHEHVGPKPRIWTTDEITFAGDIADLVARVIINSRRRQAEKQLRQAHSNLEQIFHAAVPMCVIGNGGKILMVNNTFYSYVGATRLQVLGKKCYEICRCSHCDTTMCPLRIILQGEVLCEREHEIEMLVSGGRKRHCISVATPYRSVDGQVVGVVQSFTDITDRKQAQEALAREHSLLRTLVHTLPDQIFVKDINSAFVFSNMDGGKCHDDVDSVIGKTDLDLHPNHEFAERCYKQEQEIMRTGKAMIGHDFYSRGESGAKRWYSSTKVPWRNDNGEIIGLVGLNREITEIKQAEEALRVSEEQLKLILQHSSDGISIARYDPETGKRKLLMCNDKYVEMTGRCLRELMAADDICEFMYYASSDKIRSQWDKRLKEGKPCMGQAQWIRPDGKDNCHEWTATAVKTGDRCFIIGVDRDITSRKQVAGKLMAYQKQLRFLTSELSLTEERERRRIAADLHDSIGQTLAFIQIKLEMIREEAAAAGLQKSLQEIGAIIEQTIKGIHTLIFELSPPVLHELGFEAAIEWLIEWMGRQHNLKCVLNSQERRTKIPLSDDCRVVLFRAVRELLLNVVKHAHAQSAEIDIDQDDQFVRVSVRDDGRGFDASSFGPDTKKSSGFGLFNIYERLDYLGGHLEIASEAGRGSHFTLVLPLKQNSRQI